MFSILKRRKIKTIADNIEARPAAITLIDEQLHSILRPLSIMLNLIFCAKYKIKSNVISVNSTCYSVFSLLFFLFGMTLVHFFFVNGTLFGSVDTLSFFALMYYTVDAVTSDIGSLAFFYGNYKHRKSSVLLVLTIQNALKSLNVDARKYIKINWVLVVALNLFYIVFHVYFLGLVQNFRFSDIFNNLLFLNFDLNVIYLCMLLDLLSYIVEMWIQDVSRSGLSGEFNDDAYWIKMFNVFMDVFDAYQLIIKHFKYLVSNNFVVSGGRANYGPKTLLKNYT